MEGSDLFVCGHRRPYWWYSTLVPANFIFSTNFCEVLVSVKKKI
jgi:hypothetical protein